LDVARTETVLKEDAMSDDWKDCDQPWTIDEFLEAREYAPDAHPAVWSTKQPEEDGHYWIYRPETLHLDIIEIADGDVFLGDRLVASPYSYGPWLYGSRIPTIKAPK
jgi:hypothetical protein